MVSSQEQNLNMLNQGIIKCSVVHFTPVGKLKKSFIMTKIYLLYFQVEVFWVVMPCSIAVGYQ